MKLMARLLKLKRQEYPNQSRNNTISGITKEIIELSLGVGVGGWWLVVVVERGHSGFGALEPRNVLLVEPV